ncbi:murein L,D-transpeptidase [Prosthecochloris sp. GSB1]|uniref:L,D-transpeptidase family protein n=1 Tax=Prosthecochloris sp. GSB1 TaxID=281093 RepID=UPI000B8CEFC8|nr:L,D-transpeptidase family protein [Prosthecochloris sp. GSB1]ASQ91213.1 murein L,D-transpeptidase [Prosthecochloris sp. GSB1]
MTVILVLFLAFGTALSAAKAEAAPASRQEESASQRRSSGVPNDIRESIRCHVEQLEEDVDLRIGRERVAFNALLAEFYRSNDFSPVWKKRSQITELLAAVESAEDDGLMPGDYHLAEIRNFYEKQPRSPFLKARYELLLTDAMFKLSYHLLHGKVDPEKLDPNWNLSEGRNGNGLVSKLQEALAGDSLAEVIGNLRPDHPKYVSLKEGLARYRELAAGGGWGAIPDGPSIKTVGQSDERIPALRRRLEITGEMPVVKSVDTSFASLARVYSLELQEGVRRFQKRHGLEQDGAVGPKTLRAMNVPVERRIEQIRINLDRYRWFVQKLEPTFVLVNIAGFTVQYVENGQYTWGSRVIVGEPFWKTPVFKAEMQYIIFNPSWNVPPGITRKETLPAVRKDPGYLARQNLQVIDRSGRVVDPYSVNWSAYSSGSLPYRFRQPPGSGNALGRVKFMFPNKHLVYLHDTPGKHLFGRSERAFSHGCIRLQNPLELARILLGWSAGDVQKTVDDGATRTVHLTKRVPVFLLYLTAVAEGDEVLFLDDVYSRDEMVLKALNQPFPYKSIESCVF